MKDNAAAFAKLYADKTGQTITDEQASDMLLVAGFHDVDQTAANSSQANPLASQFISGNAGGLFTATTYDYLHPNVGANANGSPTPEQVAISNGSGTPAPPPLNPPDYVSVQGSIYVASGGFTVNLHNGNFYGQWGVSRNYPAFSLTPSASATVGYIVGGADAQSTDGFLQGGALWGGAYVPTGVPFLNVGGGLNHGYTGGTSTMPTRINPAMV